MCFASRRIIEKTENRKKLCLKSISDIYERDRVTGAVAGAVAWYSKRDREGGFRPADEWVWVERAPHRLGMCIVARPTQQKEASQTGAVAQPYYCQYRALSMRLSVVEIRGKERERDREIERTNEIQDTADQLLCFTVSCLVRPYLRGS